MKTLKPVLPPDSFSTLPSSVAETILTYMPLRDAVRTSILSRKWRYVWAKLPQFVLDKTLWDNVAVEYSAKPTLMKILCQLLLCRDGPIIKFTLSNPELESCPEIDNLIFFLAKNQIEDFTLEMWKDCYVLPSSIFSCKKLSHLSLRSCSIRNFPSIGFSRLTSLKLYEVIISAETLASLISGSQLLCMLEITSSSEMNICIDAPNLKTIVLSGFIKSIEFIRVPVLSSVSIVGDVLDELVDFVGLERSIAKFFDCLHALRTLQCTYHVIGSFEKVFPKRLSTSLIHLIHLKLSDISFVVVVELSFTLCLLRSSPNLKYIEISIWNGHVEDPDETTSYMEGEDYSDICLSKLSEVKLVHVTGTMQELEFIRLLLAKSSSLKKIQIQSYEDVDNGFKFLKEVTKFRRKSEDAEIIFGE